MSMDAIYRTVFPLIQAQYGDTPIIWPNVKPPQNPMTVNHVIVSVVPTDSISQGLRTVDFETGYLQFLIKSKIETGVIQATGLANKLASIFPRNTELKDTVTGQTIRFDKAPQWKVGYNDTPWYSMPLLIPYRVTV